MYYIKFFHKTRCSTSVGSYMTTKKPPVDDNVFQLRWKCLDFDSAISPTEKRQIILMMVTFRTKMRKPFLFDFSFSLPLFMLLYWWWYYFLLSWMTMNVMNSTYLTSATSYLLFIHVQQSWLWRYGKPSCIWNASSVWKHATTSSESSGKCCCKCRSSWSGEADDRCSSGWI